MSEQTIATQTITTALTNEVLGSKDGFGSPTSATILCSFTYGSGGTTAKFYVQSSIDGNNWTDIACFAFTTSGAVKFMTVDAKKSVTTPVTISTGTLTDDTVQEGFVGERIRVVATTTGTYAGGTSVTIRVKTTDG